MTAPEIAPPIDFRLYTASMLIAVLACIVGIVVENWYWPQDRSATLGRFIDSESASEKVSLLVGLVLGHSVVRWLIAFAAAAMIVLAIYQFPGIHTSVKSAIDDERLSVGGLDAILGVVIAMLMTLLSLLARRLAC